MARKRRSRCPAADCVAADPRQALLTSVEIEKVGEPYKSRAEPLYRCCYCNSVYELVAGKKEILGRFDRATDAWYPKKQHDD